MRLSELQRNYWSTNCLSVKIQTRQTEYVHYYQYFFNHRDLLRKSPSLSRHEKFILSTYLAFLCLVLCIIFEHKAPAEGILILMSLFTQGVIYCDGYLAVLLHLEFLSKTYITELHCCIASKK